MSVHKNPLPSGLLEPRNRGGFDRVLFEPLILESEEAQARCSQSHGNLTLGAPALSAMSASGAGLRGSRGSKERHS